MENVLKFKISKNRYMKIQKKFSQPRFWYRMMRILWANKEGNHEFREVREIEMLRTRLRRSNWNPNEKQYSKNSTRCHKAIRSW